MTHYETTERLAAVVFRHLPRTTSRQAQDSHKLAKAIAVAVVEDMARIARMTPALSQAPCGYERPLGAGSELKTGDRHD